ncbi:uncharacterized protein LOC125832827 [Solanum verrucosum]|uniref:uncharacterized protein LOC125832827 n=1 Tax=Solanum verrucosum TaxID=315347 RepID=UPI0020D09AC5|nr:uncharacterized protein LOC125832827 [Solanum verrucosum]
MQLLENSRGTYVKRRINYGLNGYIAIMDKVEYVASRKYSIEKVYGKIRGDMVKVEWRILVWTNYGAPNWLSILYIALDKRLSTKDKMVKWGIPTVLTCPLCQLEQEDIDHLFFTYSFTTGVWNKVLPWQGIQ